MKDALLGFWLCLCTAAGVWLPQPGVEEGAEPPPRAAFAALPFSGGDLMAVTDIRDGAVAGYFLLRFVAVMDDREAPRFLAVQAQVLSDAVYRFFEAHPIGDVALEDGFASAKLREGLKAAINDLCGAPLVVGVLIQQLDYLTFSEVRRKSAARTLVLTP